METLPNKILELIGRHLGACDEADPWCHPSTVATSAAACCMASKSELNVVGCAAYEALLEHMDLPNHSSTPLHEDATVKQMQDQLIAWRLSPLGRKEQLWRRIMDAQSPLCPVPRAQRDQLRAGSRDTWTCVPEMLPEGAHKGGESRFEQQRRSLRLFGTVEASHTARRARKAEDVLRAAAALTGRLQRRVHLKSRLGKAGLPLRDDSPNCREYIQQGAGDLDEIVRIKLEMDFYKRRTSYDRYCKNVFRELKGRDAYYFSDDELSDDDLSDDGYCGRRVRVWVDPEEVSRKAKGLALLDWRKRFHSVEAAVADPVVPKSLRAQLLAIGRCESVFMCRSCP